MPNATPEERSLAYKIINSDLEKAAGDVVDKATLDEFNRIASIGLQKAEEIGLKSDAMEPYKFSIERMKQVKPEVLERFLNDYKNEAWMKRTIDETIKNAIDDGAETIKIPYGSTIAQIEGHTIA